MLEKERYSIKLENYLPDHFFQFETLQSVSTYFK